MIESSIVNEKELLVFTSGGCLDGSSSPYVYEPLNNFPLALSFFILELNNSLTQQLRLSLHRKCYLFIYFIRVSVPLLTLQHLLSFVFVQPNLRLLSNMYFVNGWNHKLLEIGF